MAYSDYIHCDQCTEPSSPGYKMIYDGYDDIHDVLVSRFGDDYALLCPSCIAKLRAELDRLRAGIEREAGFNDGMAAMAVRPEGREYHESRAAHLRALLEPQA